MTILKRLLIALLVAMIAIGLCGCGESDSARRSRLEKDAAEKKQAAQEARDNYNQLNNFLNKYGK